MHILIKKLKHIRVTYTTENFCAWIRIWLSRIFQNNKKVDQFSTETVLTVQKWLFCQNFSLVILSTDCKPSAHDYPALRFECCRKINSSPLRRPFAFTLSELSDYLKAKFRRERLSVNNDGFRKDYWLIFQNILIKCRSKIQ